MSTYQIESKSGAVYGRYEAATKQAAWEAMVAEAGDGAEGSIDDWIVREIPSTTTIRIDSRRYSDSNDCLADAEADYADEHGLAGWDLSPRWEDDDRLAILLDVPSESVTADDDVVA